MNRRARVAASVLVGVGLLSRPALAIDKAVCANAYEEVQRQRQLGHLRAAHEQAVLCASDGCPAILRGDCAEWLGEIDTTMPTVVLVVHGHHGEELESVRVAMDGAAIAERLSGREIAVDPGRHAFRFEVAGEAPIETVVVINSGEKLRRVEVSLPQTAPAPVAPPPAPPPAAPLRATPPPSSLPSRDESTPSERPIPASVIVLGGVSIASFAGFAYFALSGLSKKSDLDACKPNCSETDVNTAKAQFVAGDVFLGVGVISLAVATYLFVTRPEAAPKRTGMRASWLRGEF